jgi:hypothetical protein
VNDTATFSNSSSIFSFSFQEGEEIGENGIVFACLSVPSSPPKKEVFPEAEREDFGTHSFSSFCILTMHGREKRKMEGEREMERVELYRVTG